MKITLSALLPSILLALLSTDHAAQGIPDGFVQTIRCPNGGVQPQVSMQKGKGILHLIYFDGDELQAGDLQYVQSTDEGKTFSDPIRVNDTSASVDASAKGLRGAKLDVSGGGRVHVAWVGSKATVSGDDPAARPLLYARLNEQGTAFEATRSLSTGFDGLDSAPAITSNSNYLFVFWHAPGESVAEANEEEPARRIYLVRSTDGGDTFSDPAIANQKDRGVSSACGLAAAIARNGMLMCMFHTRNGRSRDLRVLYSMDNGMEFKSSYADTKTGMRSPRTGLASAMSKRGPLFAWANSGNVYWARVDNESGRSESPAGPKRKEEVWRGRTGISAGHEKVVIQAWFEGENRNGPGAIAWQAFAIRGRATIGKGSIPEVPAGAWPVLFERPSDEGVTIVY